MVRADANAVSAIFVSSFRGGATGIVAEVAAASEIGVDPRSVKSNSRIAFLTA